jgi:methyl-accepting chemotaxis protein
VVFTTLTDIQTAIGGVRIGRSGHAFLLDGGTVVIAGNLFAPAVRATAQEARDIKKLKSEVKSGGSGRATVRFKGDLYIVTSVPVERAASVHPEIDWSVAVIVKHSEAYAPAHRVVWALVALAGALLVIAIAISIPLGRSIARPITELAASAERMGSGDLTGDVAIRTRDQIGTLAAALLRMRDYLRVALGKAEYSSDKMSVLAEEQSAATQDVFSNIEEIVDSVVILARNMETLTQKIQTIMDHAAGMPPEVLESPGFTEVKRLVEESEIIAEVGSAKAVEIASSTQDQRGAVRDVAAAARRLSEMAGELKEMVSKFKI